MGTVRSRNENRGNHLMEEEDVEANSDNRKSNSNTREGSQCDTVPDATTSSMNTAITDVKQCISYSATCKRKRGVDEIGSSGQRSQWYVDGTTSWDWFHAIHEEINTSEHKEGLEEDIDTENEPDEDLEEDIDTENEPDEDLEEDIDTENEPDEDLEEDIDTENEPDEDLEEDIDTENEPDEDLEEDI
jgi:hypothetical protein